MSRFGQGTCGRSGRPLRAAAYGSSKNSSSGADWPPFRRGPPGSGETGCRSGARAFRPACATRVQFVRPLGSSGPDSRANQSPEKPPPYKSHLPINGLPPGLRTKPARYWSAVGKVTFNRPPCYSWPADPPVFRPQGRLRAEGLPKPREQCNNLGTKYRRRFWLLSAILGRVNEFRGQDGLVALGKTPAGGHLQSRNRGAEPVENRRASGKKPNLPNDADEEEPAKSGPFEGPSHGKHVKYIGKLNSRIPTNKTTNEFLPTNSSGRALSRFTPSIEAHPSCVPKADAPRETCPPLDPQVRA